MGTVGHGEKHGGINPAENVRALRDGARRFQQEHPVIDFAVKTGVAATLAVGGGKAAEALDPQLPAQLGQAIQQIENVFTGGGNTTQAITQFKGSGVKPQETATVVATPDTNPDQTYAATIRYFESFGPAYRDMHASYAIAEVGGKDVTYVRFTNANVEIDWGKYTDSLQNVLGQTEQHRELSFKNLTNADNASQLAVMIAKSKGGIVNPVAVHGDQSISMEQQALTGADGKAYESLVIKLNNQNPETTALYNTYPMTSGEFVISGPAFGNGVDGTTESIVRIGGTEQPGMVESVTATDQFKISDSKTPSGDQLAQVDLPKDATVVITNPNNGNIVSPAMYNNMVLIIRS